MTTALVNGTEQIDLVAAARAEAIRREAESKAEAEKIRAEGDAEAARIKAQEEAEKQRLANDQKAMRLTEQRADHEARMAEKQRRKEEAERAARQAREREQAAEREEQAAAEKREKAATSWRNAALGFAIVCGIVALPVQMAAFYNKDALWLLAAPIVLEGGAWVILRGAAAAVEGHRPHWHYRLIAWGLALVAASVNLWHGLHEFDPATAIGTAFASLAGPGVWDLHEHGRIRTRDGLLTRRQRRVQQRAEKDAAEKRATEAAKAEAERDAREKAGKQRAEQLAQERAKAYSDVWKHALRLAAALGETTVTEAVWGRAHNDVLGADPGEDANTIRMRNAAARRVIAARSEAPGERPIKVTNTQRDPQMPPGRGRGNPNGPKVRGVRRKGDTAPQSKGARNQARITAKQAARKEATAA